MIAATVAAPAIAGAQNFAPIASGSAPEQAFVGQQVTFSSAASIDPDGAPQPLTFRWEFDDGTISTEASPAVREPHRHR